MPLLLSHGWPGSIVEFLKILPMLTDPARFGADPADAFTVVAPSLPGYALSFAPGQKRFGVVAIAELFAGLMTDVLGYRRFATQGGDWGAVITSRLAYQFPERLIGIHLNFLAVRRDPKMLENANGRGEGVPRAARALARGGERISVDPGHQTNYARFRTDRFARRTGRVDRREVPHLDGLRR